MSANKTVEIQLSGSKSITNRALILASLSKGKILLQNIGNCIDTYLMMKNLETLGIKIKEKNPEILEIQGPPKVKNKIKLNTGDAGTTTRFLIALATLLEKEINIDGSRRMRERPIKELLDALKSLGANLQSPTGFLPVKIIPEKPVGGEIKLKGNISSQYLTAILLIAPFLEKTTIIKVEQKLYSKPYIEITLNLLKEFGLKILNKNFKQFQIPPNQKIKAPQKYYIEIDTSSASYPAAYAALHPKIKVHIKNLNKKSIQGDIKFLDYLKKMDCNIKETKKGITITGPQQLRSLKTVDMNTTPDLVMTFAVLAIFTRGKTKITNIGNLKIKETNRLQALQNELKKLKVKVKTGKDYIEITGKPDLKVPKPIIIETYNDHRIAMSFAILKDLYPNLKIANPKCVEKSYKNFWQDLKKLQLANKQAK